MTDPVQIVAIGVSVLLLLVVLDLVRRKKLTEEYSFVWIGCSLALFGLSLGRGLLDAAAAFLGVAYGPAVLLLALTFFLFVASLSFSVVISRQRQQIERLMEDVAILDAELRELQQQRAAPLGASPQKSRPR